MTSPSEPAGNPSLGLPAPDASPVLLGEERRARRLFWVLSVLVCAAFMASLLIGPAGLSPSNSLAALFGRGGADGEAHRLIMREIRLPRALLGPA
jgi:ABC-type enterobactin transport system permease subunit